MRHAFSTFQSPQVCFKTFCQFFELLPVFQARMQEEMPDGRTSPALQRLKRCTRAAAPPHSIDGTAIYRFSTLLIRTQTDRSNYVTKEQLRIELERQAQRYQDIYGGEVTTYAAKTEPERKPWRKKATLQDRVFQEELQKMEKEKARQEADAQS